jgi:outer membrane receptor for ferrienterochelin and colicins
MIKLTADFQNVIRAGRHAAFVILISGSALAAQSSDKLLELDLEELVKIQVRSVYGASKFLQKVTNAPASVSVVSADDIHTYGYRTLADILRGAYGFNATYDRNYEFIGVRGFQRPGDYNSRILVLVDGHRTNDPIYDGASVGTDFPIDVELIDRIEIIRGPSSSIYGTNAFFAVVNIITRKPKGTGLQVSADRASLDTNRSRVAYGNTFSNGLDLLVSGSVYGSAGQSKLYFPEFDSAETNSGIAANVDRDSYSRLYTSAAFKGFKFQGVYGSRLKQVPTASFGSVFNDPQTKTIDARGWTDLSYDRILGGVQFAGRVYYDDQSYQGWYADAAGTYRDYDNAKWWGTELSGQKTVFSRHNLKAGIEYRDNFGLEQGGAYLGPTTDETMNQGFRDERSSHVAAGYIQDEYTITPYLLLNGGIRHDRYPGFGGTTNPRFGLIVRPREKTALKFLWGQAFRAPNAYELYYQSGYIRSNTNLKPENIRTAELAVEHYFADHYRFSAGVHTSHVRNLITQADSEVYGFGFQNLGATTSKGLELEFEGKWESGVAGRVSYTYQRNREGESRIATPNSVRQLATANVSVPVFTRKLIAATDLRLVGSSPTVKGTQTKSFIISNFTLSTGNVFAGFSFYGTVYNAFNANYGYPGAADHTQAILYQDGRTARIGLKYTIGGSR